MKTIYVGLDIDGTVVEHCYPRMDGKDIGAVPWLLQAQENYPVVYLLNTMRSGQSLTDAVLWLEDRGVRVGGAGIHPDQASWTDSPKCHCHVYIEDRAAGTPLRPDMAIDWDKYGPMVIESIEMWHMYYEQFGPNATGPVEDVPE